jgi:PEP-CTERM motif
MKKCCRVQQMMVRLTAIMLVGVLASLLSTRPTHASLLDVTATVSNLAQIDITLNLSGNPNNVNGHYNPAFAGSIVPSSLDGTPLPFLYCVDVVHDLFIPRSGYSTEVNNIGEVHGAPVQNVAQVAWLLDRYADSVTGNTEKTAALQAAIWRVIYGDTQFTLNSSGTSSTIYGYYTAYTTGVGSAPTSIGNYTWLSPSSGSTLAQGLVTRVPEPGSTLLLAFALASLFGVGWWRRKRLPG